MAGLRKMALRPFGSRKVVIGGDDELVDQLKALAFRDEEVKLELQEELDELRGELDALRALLVPANGSPTKHAGTRR